MRLILLVSVLAMCIGCGNPVAPSQERAVADSLGLNASEYAISWDYTVRW